MSDARTSKWAVPIRSCYSAHVDLGAVVDTAVAARLEDVGQVCNAPKRFIVADDLHEVLLDRTISMATRADALAPMPSVRAAEGLEGQVNRAVNQGAVLHSTGERDGAFFPPRVLTDVTPDQDVFSQKLFGPVAMVFRFSSVAEAVELANDTPYGSGLLPVQHRPGAGGARGEPD